MSIENVTCPECDGPMASRANKTTGQRFWGCKRFPVCKGTRNTDGEARASSYREELDGEGNSELPSERQRGQDRGRWRHPVMTHAELTAALQSILDMELPHGDQPIEEHEYIRVFLRVTDLLAQADVELRSRRVAAAG